MTYNVEWLSLMNKMRIFDGFLKFKVENAKKCLRISNTSLLLRFVRFSLSV